MKDKIQKIKDLNESLSVSRAIIKAIAMLSNFEAFLFSDRKSPPDSWKNEDGTMIDPICGIKTQLARLKTVLDVTEIQINDLLSDLEYLDKEDRIKLARLLITDRPRCNARDEDHPQMPVPMLINHLERLHSILDVPHPSIELTETLSPIREAIADSLRKHGKQHPGFLESFDKAEKMREEYRKKFCSR